LQSRTRRRTSSAPTPPPAKQQVVARLERARLQGGSGPLPAEGDMALEGPPPTSGGSRPRGRSRGRRLRPVPRRRLRRSPPPAGRPRPPRAMPALSRPYANVSPLLRVAAALLAFVHAHPAAAARLDVQPQAFSPRVAPLRVSGQLPGPALA